MITSSQKLLMARAGVSSGVIDPDFANVSLLLHGDGTNGSTTFTDSSSNNFTVTASGNAQIDTTVVKYGTGSIEFDGSGDYISVPDDTDFDVSNGDFTIEFWVYLDSTSGFQNIFNKRVDASGYSFLWPAFNSSGLSLFATSNGSSWDVANNFSFGLTFTTGQWYHVALVRDGTTITAYQDGVAGVNTITTSASIYNDTLSSFHIGGDTNNFQFNGYIDDFRFTKGIARYTANFTPPTSAFPDQ